jgi:hypothetical protein
MLLAVAIVMLLVGMALGQRFTVLILAPAIPLVLATAIGLGVARSQAPWAIALAAVVAVACLQIGYLLGLGVRQLILTARMSRMRSSSFAEPPPARRPAH